MEETEMSAQVCHVLASETAAAAIAAEPRAQAWFEVLTSGNRFALIHRVGSAKRPETRARRIATLVAGLAEGRTPYPQKRRPENLPDPSPPAVHSDDTSPGDDPPRR